MFGREQVDLTIPAAEWSATLSHLEKNDKNRAPYVRIHIERAIAEWTDIDDLLETEDLLQEYEEMCPHSLPRFSQTDYSISMGDDVEKKTIRTRIDPEFKNELRQFTDEHTDYYERYGRKRYGAALATVLKLYRDGGRRQRINDRLKRLLKATEAEQSGNYDPAELEIHYNDVDLDRLDGRSRKKKHYQIAQQLDPARDRNLHPDQIMEVARSVAGPSINREDYVKPVVEILDFKPHPSNSLLYVHESWEPETKTETKIAINAEPPAIDRKTFDDMTKAERIEGIRLALARKADENGGVYTADYNFIRTRAFDRTVSKGYASNVMEDIVEDADGFIFDTQHGSKRIKVDTARICDSLLESAGLSEPPAVEQDRNQEKSKSDPDLEAEVDAKMDELIHGAPTSDGGVATTDGGTDVW